MARLFTVREYDSAWKDLMSKVFASFRDIDPLLSQIPSIPTRHRGPIRNVSGPDPLDHELRAIESKSVMENDDVRAFNIEAHSAFIHELATGLVSEVKEGLFQIISEVTDRTGNVIDAKGQPLTPELYLDTLEKMEITFDEDGNPQLPTLFGAPEALKRFSEAPRSEEYEKRRLAILERKKEEFLAKKRTRRIR